MSGDSDEETGQMSEQPEAGYHYVYAKKSEDVYHSWSGLTYHSITDAKRLAVREAINLGLEPCAECYSREP